MNARWYQYESIKRLHEPRTFVPNDSIYCNNCRSSRFVLLFHPFKTPKIDKTAISSPPTPCHMNQQERTSPGSTETKGGSTPGSGGRDERQGRKPPPRPATSKHMSHCRDWLSDKSRLKLEYEKPSTSRSGGRTQENKFPHFALIRRPVSRERDGLNRNTIREFFLLHRTEVGCLVRILGKGAFTLVDYLQAMIEVSPRQHQPAGIKLTFYFACSAAYCWRRSLQLAYRSRRASLSPFVLLLKFCLRC